MNIQQDKAILKVVVKINEMDDEMYTNIHNWAYDSFIVQKVKYKDEMVKFYLSKEVANFIKEKLEEKYKDLCWHVILGRNYGGCITHQNKHYVYFYLGQMGFTVFATVHFLFI